MKTLILILALIFASATGFTQCMGDSLISVTKDSLYVGDTLTVNVYYDANAGAWSSDSVFLSMNPIVNFIQYAGDTPYLHDWSDVDAAYHPFNLGNLSSKIKIKANAHYTDTVWTKVFIYTTQNNSCGSAANVIRQYIYVKDTTHKVNGINELTDKAGMKIKEVRYYTITGQLYGTYSQKQNHLPNVPLIEEVIYTNNSIATRRLLEF